MIATGAKKPRSNIGRQQIRNIYLTLLLFHVKFLNLSENIGISDTRKYEKRPIRTISNSQPMFKLLSQSPPPAISDDQKRALAGVGKPMNVDVWRVSILNFASLYAEKTAIRNAT